eukprot:6484758-Pyramimonas_sp.AAC.1
MRSNEDVPLGAANALGSVSEACIRGSSLPRYYYLLYANGRSSSTMYEENCDKTMTKQLLQQSPPTTGRRSTCVHRRVMELMHIHPH